MRQSRLSLKGHKRELLGLDLSFIFWILLKMLNVIGFISQLFSHPYMQTSYVLYYDSLKKAKIE